MTEFGSSRRMGGRQLSPHLQTSANGSNIAFNEWRVQNKDVVGPQV